MNVYTTFVMNELRVTYWGAGRSPISISLYACEVGGMVRDGEALYLSRDLNPVRPTLNPTFFFCTKSLQITAQAPLLARHKILSGL